MTEAAAIELRVLSGPHAGCRLPLAAGLYRAGADECCDIVLDGMSAGEVAFVLYVGRKTVALESLADGVSIDGKPASGLRELRQGQAFEFASWLFVVDEAAAPWPEDPESLRAGTRIEASPDVSAGELAQAGELDAEAVSAEAADEAVDGVGVGVGVGVGAESVVGDAQVQQPQQADSALAKVRRGSKSRMPFWAVGLTGTAAFLGFGVLALALTLSPAKPAAIPEAASVSHALTQIAESASPGGEVQLEQLPAGRYRLSGYITTRQQRTALTREARRAEPMVLIRITADEDLESLARETLARFPTAGVRLGSVNLGRMELEGHVVSGTVRDQVVAAIRDGVPGLRNLENKITASDDALIALRGLLAGAGLAEKIEARLDESDAHRLIVAGTPDEAARAAWLGVRGELTTQLGLQLEIVERFETPAQKQAGSKKSRGREGVVAVVAGPMPYVLMENGSKVAAQPANEEQ